MGTEPIGRVVGLHRYPVKSMRGEDLEAVEVTPGGLLGDRAYALIDCETGHVVSAKRPRKWPAILDCGAAFQHPPRAGAPVPPVRIELPGGATLSSVEKADLDRRMSAELGTPVRLASVAPEGAAFEYHWPDMDGLVVDGRAYRDEITEHEMPPGTFFDGSTLLLLTTASLARMGELVPGSEFDARRFRPNLVIEPTIETGFVENDWLGRTLHIGDDVRLEITRPCIRCVMTTLPQGNLPKDPEVLRAAFTHNEGNLGVNAAVAGAGRVSVGDDVRFR